jgi:hypothetical protein
MGDNLVPNGLSGGCKDLVFTRASPAMHALLLLRRAAGADHRHRASGDGIQAKPSQAKPSQAKPSQAKPSQAKRWRGLRLPRGAAQKSELHCAPGRSVVVFGKPPNLIRRVPSRAQLLRHVLLIVGLAERACYHWRGWLRGTCAAYRAWPRPRLESISQLARGVSRVSEVVGAFLW